MGHRFDFWRVLWCREGTAHRRTLWSNQVAAEFYVRRVNRIRRIGLLVWSLQLWPVTAAVVAAPAISSFSPAQGRPGIQVTLNGSGFSTASEVRFNDVVADFSATADNRIIAVVPLDAATGPIRVINPSGTGSSSSNFVVSPVVTDFFPTRSATNTVVTINGLNFIGTTNVSFNSRTVAFSVTAPTQIRVTVPFGATNGPIIVQTSAGTATSTNDFMVIGPAPIIDDFSPAFGSPGTTIVISGVNFTNVQEVRFNGVLSGSVSAPAQTTINAQVPATATSGKISVKTAAGTSTSTNNFTVTRAPVVTNFFPGRGKAGLTQVTIEGVNFSGVTGVGFNGRPVGGIGTPAPNQLLVSVPPGATTGPITVTNGFGSGASTVNFVVTSAPLIDNFFPESATPGTIVVINGANFTGVPSPGGVKFNGTNAAFVAVTADTQVHATVPAGATTGPITVTNAFGSGTSISNFTVIGDVPYLTELSPDTGPRATQVIISGKNFTSPATVKFNGVTDPGAAVTAPTQIRATVPTAATTGPVSVTTAAGTSTNQLIFYIPPRLTTFTPTNGIVGDEIVLRGTNFDAASSVLFNNAGSAFTINASNMITATVPTNASTGPLTVVTPGGVIITTNDFRVLPRITGFVPALGPTGTVVTISGTSFINVTNVTFNSAAAAFTPVSIGEVRATVPPNGTTGPIRVSTPDGTAMSPTDFVVTRSSDLALTMSASASVLKPNESLTYTITVTNTGPEVVSGVVVTNVLSSGVDFVTADSTRGTCTNIAGKVICDVGPLTNSAGLTITIVVTTVAEGELTSSATVTAVEPDLFPSNNTAAVTTTVVRDESRTLQIILAAGASNAIISWPVSPVFFALQSVEQLSVSNLWLSVTNMPAVVGARYTVTNDVSGGKRFYRLSKP